MNILTLNVGSSSIKYSFYKNKEKIESKYIERVKDFETEIKKIIENLVKKGYKINAIGHRVVHGKTLTKPIKIDDKTLKKIEEASELAPLHNPPEIKAIKICKKNFKIPNIAVFDTAFHQTIPDYAYNYAIPKKLRELGIRKYGFHGTSHKYVMQQAQKILGKKKLNAITIHLGNGCSMTAIKNNKSIDTSMGFTPLEGLIMGTRSGDIDPGIFNFLANKGYSVKEIDHILNKESGIKGISGISNDMRDIMKKMKTNKNAKLAYEMFIYRIKKYIGAYYAILGKVDAIILTGGMSINPQIRKDICSGLTHLGIKMCNRKNNSGKTIISHSTSKTKILQIKTDEELMIRDEVEIVLSK